MLKEFKEKAKRKVRGGKQGTIRRLNIERIYSHSAVLSGNFANGAECEVLADQGSDTNLLSGNVWKLIKESLYKSRVTHLVPPKYLMV